MLSGMSNGASVEREKSLAPPLKFPRTMEIGEMDERSPIAMLGGL
jgi:hypothetical protein